MTWKTLFSLFGFTALVYIVNVAANALGVYEAFPRFDIPMHLLGGASIAVMMLVLWQRRFFRYSKERMESIPFLIQALTVLGFVALIGICWEWKEFLSDLWHAARHLSYIPEQPSQADTMKDLFMDLLGGGITVLLARFFKRSY